MDIFNVLLVVGYVMDLFIVPVIFYVNMHGHKYNAHARAKMCRLPIKCLENLPKTHVKSYFVINPSAPVSPVTDRDERCPLLRF